MSSQTGPKATRGRRRSAPSWGALAIAMLLAFTFSIGTAHAFAGTHANAAGWQSSHAVSVKADQHVQGVPCDDHEADANTGDGCCLLSAPCAFCAPLADPSIAVPTPLKVSFGLETERLASGISELQLRPPRLLAHQSARAA